LQNFQAFITISPSSDKFLMRLWHPTYRVWTSKNM
jgi:hypothetical protein